MRRSLPSLVLSASLALFTLSSSAQDRFAYAITDVNQQGAGWNALRKIDLTTGQISDVLLNGADQSASVYDATTKKLLAMKADPQWGNVLNSPFSTGVAAAAYDKKHNRLYFTPMFVDQLRYVDLKTMKVYFVTDGNFSKAGNMHHDEGKIITRMVIAPDGYGYAISNDGNTFVRFSTGKNRAVEHLGALVDDPSNNGISVHNRCSSFGSDMIADDKGKLYIISARNQVFVVDPETKVAKHAAGIKNLPANFTSNGAVVNTDGALLVSSAVDASAYYVVNPKDWTATPFALAGSVIRSSDLANSNYLSSRGTTRPELTKVDLVKPIEGAYSKLISVYPNPVKDNNMTLQFNKVPVGDYTVEVTDIVGRTVLQKRVTVNNELQQQVITLGSAEARGTYMIRVVDRSNVAVYNQKVLVQ